MSNEIKKALYKEKSEARLSAITKAGIKYSCWIGEMEQLIWFLIPLEEIGDAVFHDTMKASLLIRYIVKPD